MRAMSQALVVLMLLISLAGCMGHSAKKADAPEGDAVAACSSEVPAVLADDAFRVALWQQTAAEYDALSLQVFARAQSRLRSALKRQGLSAIDRSEHRGGKRNRPAAIISDIDETLLDSSPFMVRQMREPMPACLSVADARAVWTQRWVDWVQEAQAQPLKGAAEFMQAAHDQGVRIFYVTNRKDNEKSATCENLVKAKFPLEDCASQVLTRNDGDGRGRDKVSRRQSIAEDYRVLMLFGDNLGDFIGNVQTDEAQRDAIVAARRNWWGRRWFILPNAAYGSWEEILGRLDEAAPAFETAAARDATIRARREARLQDCRQQPCLLP